LSDVPVDQGRLASVAVTVKNKVYLLGGYTVAPDGSEASMPENLQFDPLTEQWQRKADIPTPVDDSVAFSYQDRYIYLISGWHNEDNVSLTQVYDTQTDQWARATNYPGTPVFGHAGVMANNQIIIADGVAVLGRKNGRRQYGLICEAWHGEIDKANPLKIDWQQISSHPYAPLYRIGAFGDNNRNQIIFAGGGDNAYNYNGIGYDGVPANPSTKVFAYDLKTHSWQNLGDLHAPSMDHRAIANVEEDLFLMGGMGPKQHIIGDLSRLPIR